MSELSEQEMTPAEIVAALDQHIVGQTAAKRAVAVALRNRWRWSRLPAALQREVTPRNILMAGPTGVGKTEIARRLADLAGAPLVKVEATKFTEVGYHGRDVESMVRDLVEAAAELVRRQNRESIGPRIAEAVEDRLLDALLPGLDSEGEARELLRGKLRAGEMEDREVELSVEQKANMNALQMPGLEDQLGPLQGMFESMMPRRTHRKAMRVSEARRVLAEEEADRRLDESDLDEQAVRLAEDRGILFIDEIDKLCSTGKHDGEVSRRGVQRDLLPLVEGTTVTTRRGAVRTDRVLFVAAGAFHDASVDDLMPELQGRFPIRVELEPLTRDDLRRILTEPAGCLTRQYAALLEVEGLTVEWTDEGLDRLAERAFQANRKEQNLGARRLPAMLERLLEEFSYEAPEMRGQTVKVTRGLVDAALK